MWKLLAILGALFLVVGLGGVASASLVNGGFETGDLTGWSGTSSVVTNLGTYSPKEGTHFAWIDTGDFVIDIFVDIRQTVSLTAGQVLSGFAAFYSPGAAVGAYGVVRILDSAGGLVDTPWKWPVDEHNAIAGGGTAWESWSWTAPGSGSYTLSLGAFSGVPSDRVYAFFDGNAVVPLPGSVLLLGSGLLGLGAVGRWRKRG